jgi:hypothetical protein
MSGVPMADYILYDGECPVCSQYMALANLRKVAPSIQVIDARQRPDLVEEHRKNGVEINEGMVIKIGENVMSGADAFATINRFAAPRSAFPKFCLRLLSMGSAPRLLYPALKFGRRILLIALRRKMI